MDQGGLTSFNADGTKIAYNRIFRNFRTWKRYTGGLAQDIYIYDIKNNVLEQQIPHTDYTDTFPMWHGNTVYFTSEKIVQEQPSLVRRFLFAVRTRCELRSAQSQRP